MPIYLAEQNWLKVMMPFFSDSNLVGRHGRNWYKYGGSHKEEEQDDEPA